MAILHVFSLHDSKVGSFGVPFFQASIGQAVRSVTELCSDPQSLISRYPGDFALFYLGQWDDLTGAYTPNVPPSHLGGGEQFIPAVPRPPRPSHSGVYPLEPMPGGQPAEVRPVNGEAR